MPPKKTAGELGDATEDDVFEDEAQLHPDATSSVRTTHSREKLRLCEQIILDHFGPVAARVASVLLQRGRLSLIEIQRFVLSPDATAGVSSSASASNTTQAPILPQKPQILHTVLALVQHNILYHVRIDSDGNIIRNHDEQGGYEFFEINPEAILIRNRFGSFMETAERLWGQEGLTIIQMILLNGKLQVSDLISRMDTVSPYTRPLLTYMLMSAYLIPSSVMNHISPHELTIAYTLEAKRHFKGIPGPKDMRLIDSEVAVRIVKERAENRGTGVRSRTESDTLEGRASVSNGKKRGSITSTSNGRRKKGRLAVETSESDNEGESSVEGQHGESINLKGKSKAMKEGTTNGGAGKQGATNSPPAWMESLTSFEKERLDEIIVDEDAFVRVNYDRFDVHIRNELLEDLIANHFNKEAARVFMRVVQAGDARKVEQDSWPSMSDRRGEPVSLNRLFTSLPSSFNLWGGFDRSTFDSLTNGKKMSRFDLLCEYIALLSRSEDTITQGNRGSWRDLASMTSALRFLLPGTSSRDIVTPTGTKLSGSAVVDFRAAARKLKWNMLKQTVESVFGESEGKVMGVLRREGKLEEKQISKLALLSSPDTREACNQLFSAGVIALQEVPKSADRNPQRTFFLYYIDYPRALSWLEDRLYRTEARLAQRRCHERDRARGLLAKIERTDVQSEGVEKVLSQSEKKRLEDCRGRLRALTVQMGRVERESWILSRMGSG